MRHKHYSGASGAKAPFLTVLCYNDGRPPTVPPSIEREKQILNQDVMNCPDCGRRTPSARASCQYCGADLPVTQIEVAPPQRPIESFEQAFNTILDPSRRRAGVQAAAGRSDHGGIPALRDNAGSDFSGTEHSGAHAIQETLPSRVADVFPAPVTYDLTEQQLASALGIELDEARAFVAAGKPVPVARSQSRQEAELIAALIRTCGMAASVIPDQDLNLGTDLLRARRIELGSAEIQVYHAGGCLTVMPSEINLMVVGMLRNNRTDYTEGIAGMRGQSGAVLDSFEYRSEEILLDVYGASLDQSFRILSDAFDYSGLLSPLSFRSELNFKASVEALSQATGAAVDSDFARLRRLLARAWPERTRSESRGVKRAGLAYRLVAKSSLISTNRDQFDRYSRLRFVMKG
jgi:hypothetical protein